MVFWCYVTITETKIRKKIIIIIDYNIIIVNSADFKFRPDE